MFGGYCRQLINADFPRRDASSFQAVCVQRVCRDFVAVNIPGVKFIDNRLAVYHQLAVHADAVLLCVYRKRETSALPGAPMPKRSALTINLLSGVPFFGVVAKP